MKHTIKLIAIIALAAVVGFSMAGCGNDAGGTPSGLAVMYQANGGTGAVPQDTNTYPMNALVTVMGPGSLSMNGYTFLSWNTNPSGSGVTYFAGSQFNILGNMILYAQWTTAGGPPVGGAPAAPIGLTATAVSSSRIELQWNAVLGATGYKVYVSSSASGPFELRSQVQTNSEYNYDLPANTTRYYQVSAFNASGESPRSNTAFATTLPGPVDPPNPPIATGVFMITGIRPSFTATRNGGAIPGADGKSIADVITAIRTAASGADCEIQFGSGAVLDIGYNTVTFNNTGGNWGAITLRGSLTSTSGAISMAGPSIISYADITSDGRAFYNTGTGSLTISGGTLSSKSMVIFNSSSGALNISGGTVSTNTNNYAIQCTGNGTVTISGGTVVSSTNSAISLGSNSGAMIYISGNATVSGGSATNSTIRFEGTSGQVYVSGGTVRNTSVAVTGNVFSFPNHSQSPNIVVEISGGTITTSALNNTVITFADGSNSKATVKIRTGVVSPSQINFGKISNSNPANAGDVIWL